MLNRVVLIGRLTKDPELRYTTAGNATCSFTLACDRSMKNAQGEKETDFIQCNVPPYKKQLAELCANYLSKGKMAAVDGRIQVRTYDDNNGQKHWITEVIAEDVRFLSPKDEHAGAQQTQTPPPYQQTPPQQKPQQGQFYPDPNGQQSYQGQPGQPTNYQQPGAPAYPGNYTPPGYQPQGPGQPPQGQWGAPPPQGFGQPPGQQPQGHPNMPNPNYPPQTPPQGGQQYSFGHEVKLDDDSIPF